MNGRRINCLVTGGAGFIGSKLAARLLAEGWAVTVVDDLSSGRELNLPAGARFIRLHLDPHTDLRKLDKLQIEVVFHLAAQSSGEISFEDPRKDMMSNAGGTLRLLDWATGKGVDHFLLASSMTVYGDASGPVEERMSCCPVSFYGVSKLAAEFYVKLFARRGMAHTILRMFNVYGPGQSLSNRKQGMFSIYLSYLLKGDRLPVRGALSRIRDFVYIDDVVEAWWQCANRSSAKGKTLNLGSGVPTKVSELVRLMFRELNRPGRGHPVQVLGPTPGDVRGFWADMKETRKTLRWIPRIPLKEGLHRTTESYRRQVKGVAA